MFSRFLPSTSVKDICCYPVVFKDKLYSYRLKNKTSRLYRTQSPQQPRLPIHKHVAFFEEQGYKSTIKKTEVYVSVIFLLVGKMPGYIWIRLQIITRQEASWSMFQHCVRRTKTVYHNKSRGQFITTSQIHQFNKENPARYE